MNRREFLLTSGAILAGLPSWAATAYTPGLVEQELAAGKTVFLDFKAAWCSTCARQERIVCELRRANPAYDEAISFINVDWDQYRNDPLTIALNIPRRSTLVALKGDEELGRIVAGTSRPAIQALMDTALAAATA